MIKIALCGYKGRMGGRIEFFLSQDPDMKILSRIDAEDAVAGAFDDIDVVIDFSSPSGAIEHIGEAAAKRKPFVLGTTGFSSDQEAEITRAASKIALLKSSNMSIGVNLLLKIIEETTAALGNSYSISIEETHHVHKKDSPSGTALMMKKSAAKNFNGEIGIVSHRKGEVAGDHKIAFEGEEETLTFFHHAKSRDLFARGAVAAAKWIVGRKAGLYTMQDVLFKYPLKSWLQQ
ncbi:MAG TPA: dihydrodipicolinate reductase C-terminal domain-containing protein [bacterium]|jgi:4-hydroxy-tetrahydrodipicolinate reductase|nr:4-hydroxy-tetrahydrodipicolinate reductase [Myxococcales bacterium]OQA61412.1 MAG: 4-hydroxy-tetrahydrodipicolinate reductase [bacterium ADurb.Bin270]HPW45643.1 dihydrodipicolinate reductase C-terminal domain-containing protein [bacterium]HQC50335.1 dihydrodipicolinate reductase C-terminal domain-containing protein [bacterium]HQG13931.1 dihydrodipicolinate reductase C-terminal domain-containing protein [bacterium]